MTTGRTQDSRSAPGEPRRRSAVRRGPHLGPVKVTAARVFLFFGLLGGAGFLAYSIFFRDALQVPLMATGFAILGIVLGLAAAMSIGGVIRAGRDGRDATAFFTSLVGGLFAVASLMCLAAAVIMSMIWSGTTA